MKIKTKIWFEKEKHIVFGFGKCEIFKAIDKYGSLSKAAEKLKMSYRSVWSHVTTIEKRFEKTLVTKTKGGKNGGGATLTDFAKKLVNKYEDVSKKIEKYANKCFGER